MYKILIALLFVTPLTTHAIEFGINAAGLEFGSKHGTYGIDYVAPDKTYGDRGFTTVRLPFSWERIQHAPYNNLDLADLRYIDEYIDKANNQGIHVLLDMHNYGRFYGRVVNPYELAYAWRLLAQRYKGKNVSYGIMNEPHDFPRGKEEWKEMAQASIFSIRSVDTETPIVVGGYSWSGAWTWEENSSNLASLEGDNLIFEAHQYFDQNGSGNADSQCVAGGERLDPFVNWLRNTGNKGIIGEYGVAGDPQCLNSLRSALNTMSDADDVIVASYYWAGGPWWGGYKFSIEDPDSKQMQVISEFMDTPTEPTPVPPPTQPQVVYSDQLMLQKLDEITTLLAEIRDLLR